MPIGDDILGFSMLANNQWVRSSGTLQGKPISIQHRADWQLAKDVAEYAICVQLAWHAQSVDEHTGFPSLAEQGDILIFSERLQQAIETNENALIVMVLAHDGINQWVIYTRDLEQLKAAIEGIPDQSDSYPIEVVADSDPDWQTFSQIYQVIVQP